MSYYVRTLAIDSDDPLRNHPAYREILHRYQVARMVWAMAPEVQLSFPIGDELGWCNSFIQRFLGGLMPPFAGDIMPPQMWRQAFEDAAPGVLPKVEVETLGGE